MSARDLVERIDILKSILIARATGRPTDDKQYKLLRQELLENSRIRDRLPLFLRYCSDLEGFWNFIQPQSPTYQGRRNYIHQAFEPVLSMPDTLSLDEFEREQPLETPISSEEGGKWDLFICHATEDKEEIVRPLVNALISEGFHVWYDEFALTIGDSLRRSIDKGLARSEYGLVILSPNFFAKNWPQTELDGLVARERDRKKVILPVWHKVDEKYVKTFSPILADRVAVPTIRGIDSIVAEILRVVEPSKTKQKAS